MTNRTRWIALTLAGGLVLAPVIIAGVYTVDHGSTARAVVSALGHATSAVVQAQGQAPNGGPPFGGPGGRGRFGGPGGPGPNGPFGPGGLPLNRLGLSDAQKDQAKSVMQGHQQELKALADRERTAREALNAAVGADVMDEGAIRARAAELAAVEADMAVTQARIRAEIFQLLTSEQQAQVKQLQAEMQQRLEQRRQGRGPRPPQ